MATKRIMNNEGYEVRRGDVYRDMISGEKISVVSADKKEAVFDDGRHVTSMACFSYCGNEAGVLEVKKEDFSVENGIFTYQDEKIQTGTMVVKDIIGVIPGGVIIVAFDERKKVKNVYRYFVEDDKFEVITSDISEYEMIYDAAPVMLIQTKSVSDHKVAAETEDEEPVVVQGVSESILVLFDGQVENCISGHAGDVIKTVKKGDDKTVLIMTSDMVFEDVVDIDGYEFQKLVPTDEGATEIFELSIQKVFEEDVEEEPEVVGVNVFTHSYHAADEVTDISVINDNRDSLFVVTASGITYTNKHRKRQACGADVVAVAKNYPICVNFKGEGNFTQFILANKDYEAVRINVTLTDDRGYVTEIEEI